MSFAWKEWKDIEETETKTKKNKFSQKKKTEAKYTIVIQQAKNVSDRYEQNKARRKDDFE